MVELHQRFDDDNDSDDELDNEEQDDTFDVAAVTVPPTTTTTAGSSSSAVTTGGGGGFVLTGLDILRRDRPITERSVGATEVASSIGSVVGPARDACLKSMTFYKSDDIEWDVVLSPTPINDSKVKRRWLRGPKPRFYIAEMHGILTESKLLPGDYIKSVNGRRLSPLLPPDQAVQQMRTWYDKDGYLSIVAATNDGDDIVVEATIVIPSLLYDTCGMIVWYWGYLCIKEIGKESPLFPTVLRETDHLKAINDVVLDKVTPERFASALDSFVNQPVTLSVLRRKQRATGKFG